MSDLVRVRKVATFVEEIRHDGGPLVAVPALRAAVAAVIHNPYAGRYVEDITDRKSTRLNSSHNPASRMPSSA
jgi:hypothetical protein